MDLRPKLKSLHNLTLFGAGFATIAGWLAGWHWLLELFSHFRLQYIVILFAAALIYGLQRRWSWSVAALVLCGINVPPVGEVLQLSNAASASDYATPLVLVSVNLNSQNKDVSAVLDFTRTEQPDVLVLQEFTFRWAADLAALENEFPHHFQRPQEDSFGLAVYSRWPLTDTQAIALGDSTPALNTTVAAPQGLLQVIAVHLRPPMTGPWAAERAAQFRHLAGLVAVSQLPLAVLGDFNATPWSPDFRHWTVTSQLQHSPGGGGLAYTWPVAMPIFWIPIDACVVNENLMITSQHRGTPIGSDHYPLITSVQLTKL
jgi:endonuclease/exonuclease/phosphatase (EEP) superfamily protein YafD